MSEIDKYIKSIPLYASLYGKKIQDFQFFENMTDYPLLEKSHIIKNFPQNWITPALQNAIDNDAIETTTTSGTSGQRIRIFRKKGWWHDEYERTYRNSAHLKDFQVGVSRKAILTTAICSNTTCYLDYPSYKDRIISNTLYLNLNHDPNSWSKSEIMQIAAELNAFQPIYLDADPIYLALFLKKLKEIDDNYAIHLPDVITLSYELVTSYTRRYIQNILNVPIFNMYGSTELGYIYIENNESLTHCPDLSHIEFVPYFEKKGIYYLIISSMKNEFMPFIRFKIGDLVKIKSSDSHSISSDDAEIEYICGREKDVTFNDSGEPVTPGEIDNALSELTNNVLIYQLQLYDFTVHFRYVSYDDLPLSESARNDIKNRLIYLFGNSFKIIFRQERSISPEISGKFSIVKRMQP